MLGVIVLLIGGVFFAVNAGKVNQNEVFNFIDGVTLTEQVENKESFVVYAYGEYCSYCKEFAPMLEGYLAENGYKIDKMVTDTSEANYKALVDIVADKMQGTPAMYVFKDGELIDFIVGLPTRADFDAFTTKNAAYFSLPQN